MLFGVLGVALVVMGVWGAHHVDRLGVVPSWDEKSADRRKRVIRRGAITCVVIGVLFLVASGISVLFPAPPPPLRR